MDKNQKFVSGLLADLQGRLENAEDGFQSHLLERVIELVEGYIVIDKHQK